MSGHAIIIDPGSGFVKAGYQTDEYPRAVFPTIVGRPRRRYANDFDGDPAFVGEAAVEDSVRNRLSFSHPIDHGHIDDWMEIEEIWAHIFYTCLEATPSENPVLITHPPLASQVHKEKMLEAMFESHDVPELNLSMQAVLALYSSGRTTGIVIEIGDGVTQVAPTYEGYSATNALRRSDIGGQDITMYLQKLLCDEGYQLTKRDDKEHVRIIKEKVCYVAKDPIEEDTKEDVATTYQLPDGKTLNDGVTDSLEVGSARFVAPEILFDPQIVQRDNPALVDLIWQSVQASPIETRKALLSSVVLSGGTSLFPGLPQRLETELKLTAPVQARSTVRIVARDDRLFSVWGGGRLFCDPAMRSMQDLYWYTNEEWQEEGARVLKRKGARQ